jgi:hypothetical protein
LLRGPAAFLDEQLPQARVVERPQDVGRALDVDAQRPLLVEAGDDRALVGAELGLDATPERADVSLIAFGRS